MILRRAAAVAIGSLALSSCSLLVDTDGLSGSEQVTDAGDGGAVGDAPSDTPQVVDASMLPVPCEDASPSATCRLFGLCCPAEAPYCRVAIDYPGRASTTTCAKTPDARRFDDPCTPDAGQCADGLSCTLVYPSASTSYLCRPLCKEATDCGDGGLFCNHRVSANEPVKQCGQCDAVETGSDCPANLPICSPTTTTGPPRCITTFTGTHRAGATCNGEHDCQIGLVCQCRADGGALLFGGDCAMGTCRVPCYPYDEGKACGGGTCTIVGGTDYALCLP